MRSGMVVEEICPMPDAPSMPLPHVASVFVLNQPLLHPPPISAIRRRGWVCPAVSCPRLQGELAP